MSNNKRVNLQFTPKQILGSSQMNTLVTAINEVTTRDVTYTELKNLCDSGGLIPGQKYRMTDFVTTVNKACWTMMFSNAYASNSDKMYFVNSANHPFDLILTAVDEYNLDENASAVRHNGDSYFPESTKFESWELKYSINNDVNKYLWARDASTIGDLVIGTKYVSDRPIYGYRRSKLSDRSSGNEYRYSWLKIGESQGKLPSDSSFNGLNWRACRYYDIVYTSSETPTVGDSVMSGSDYFTIEYISDTTHNPITQSDGKGVIYYMKDEFGNSCPYDFKNIVFGAWIDPLTSSNTDPSVWLYTYCAQTISDNAITGGTDDTLYGNSKGNVIEPTFNESGKMVFPVSLPLDSVSYTKSSSSSGALLQNCVAEGFMTEAGSKRSSNNIKELGASDKGFYAHSEGYMTIAGGNSSHAEGKRTTVGMWGVAAHTEGYQTEATSTASHAEGDTTKAWNWAAHAEGNLTTASGNCSHAEGQGSTASGNASHAEGAKYENNRNTESLGQASHAEGASTYAKADGSHAEGVLTTAGRLLTEVADAAQQLGITGTQVELVTKLAGYGAHAEGTNNNALGSSSHAEGNATNALANATHAEGDTTTAFGESSHAEGYNTQAKGNQSHAEGQGTVANGNGSHAEGIGSASSGSYSHAEGSHTESEGRDSHAEGAYSKASGIASHAEGDHTTTSNTGEHAEGTYNRSNTGTIHSVGIGTGVDASKNAFEIMSDGSIYVVGLGGYNGTNPTESSTLQQIITQLIAATQS